MDKRQFGSSLVRRDPSKHNSNILMTLIPKGTLEFLGNPRPDYVEWSPAGGFYRLVRSSKEAADSRRVRGTYSTSLLIHPDIVKGLGVNDGGTLDWFVVSEPRGRWKVHVRAGKKSTDGGNMLRKGASKAKSGASRRRLVSFASASNLPKKVQTGVPSGMSRRRIVSSRARKYWNYGYFVTCIIPHACHTILRLPDPARIKWVKSGSFYKIVPCETDDPGSLKVWNNNKGAGTISYKVRVDANFKDELCPDDTSILDWYVASDGKGRWEIHVRRSEDMHNSTKR